MEKIKKELNVQAILRRSSGGVFEVTVNDELIYSKRKTGHFPDEDKLIAMLTTH
jgi:selT/selW/selH-like putative selenoprotein